MSTIYDRAVRALQRIHPELDSNGHPLGYYCGGPERRCEHRACRAVSELAEDGLLGYTDMAGTTDGDWAATALDQLKLADDLAETREQLHANALAAAQVHAQLELAQVVREAGIKFRGWPF